MRWFRFLWAVGVPWDQATRAEARDYSRWGQAGGKPESIRWWQGARGPAARKAASSVAAPRPNRVTGKAPPGPTYAPATAAHGESVLRAIYDLHVETGHGPMVNPFPLARERQRSRPGAHRSPMDPPRNQRPGFTGPDSSGVRRGASRTRSSTSCSPRSGRTVTGHSWRSGCPPVPGPRSCWGHAAATSTPAPTDTVIRKGTRAMQPLPASPDASYGCGSTRPSSTARCLQGGMTRCGGRCAGRSGSWPITPPARCSPAPAPCWAQTGPS